MQRKRLPFVSVAGLDESVAPLIARGDYEQALDALFVGADTALRTEELCGRAIYLPGLDRWVQQIGQTITAQSALGFAAGDRPLVIASELYESGGHSRVIADICRVTDPKPIVLLTDVFGRYARGSLKWSGAAWLLPTSTVLKLPPVDLTSKIRSLLRTIASVRPSAIFLFAHHQDVVAYAAANAALPIPQWYFHHCDHHPALGATVSHYRHLDFTRELQALCMRFSGSGNRYLPLCAPDQGVRRFDYPLQSISTVSSGAFDKYATAGPLAYHELVAALLSRCASRHYHIGPVPTDYRETIDRILTARSIDPSRFVHIPQVDSLWSTLLSLDAHVYVTSVPVPGVRTAIEVQGVGYPVAFFSGEQRPFLSLHSLYAPRSVAFDSAPGLVDAVNAIAADHARCAAASRAHYFANHSQQVFESALRRGGLD